MFDYIIIGAGSAGAVLANRLSANPAVRVLLLEAGKSPSSPLLGIPAGMPILVRGARYNWQYKSEPEHRLAGRQIRFHAGRTLGGSSAINGTIYMRGDAQDYDDWRQQGNAGWGWDDVLPYFRRSECHFGGESPAHGDSGGLHVSPCAYVHPTSEAFIAAGQNLGLPLRDDFNTGRNLGIGFLQTTIRNGRRWSTDRAFLRPIRNRRNLRIETDAMVRRILIDRNRATGVEVCRNGKIFTEMALGEIIVSSGAIGSPKLLMLSGIGPGAHLSAHGIDVLRDLPVGRNLHDHLTAGTTVKISGGHSMDRSHLGLARLGQALRYFFTRSGPVATGGSQAVAFLSSLGETGRADTQVHFRPYSLGMDSHWRVKSAGDREDGVSGSAALLRPLSRGQVELRGPDPDMHPVIRPNFLGQDDDLVRLCAGLRWFARLMRAQPLGALLTEKSIPGDPDWSDKRVFDYIRQTSDTINHPVGTCKMGQDESAVVDEQLRVRGIDGLRVIDASIMPTIPSGNTNAPTIMIGEKGADMILRP